LNISARGLKLIKDFEGRFLKAYYCPAGVLTIGYGHTNLSGVPPKVVPGMTITADEAETMLRKTLAKVYEPAVRRNVHVPLTQYQYDAMVSFVYNVGEGNFKKSGVLKAINARQYDRVPGLLMQWTKAKGRVLQGLVNRRRAEGVLWGLPSVVLPYPKPTPTPTPEDDVPPSSGPMPQEVEQDKETHWAAFWRQLTVILGTIGGAFATAEFKTVLAIGVVGIAAYAVWVATGKPKFWKGEF
jgi:lysozyme